MENCNRCGTPLKELEGQLFCANCGNIPSNQPQPKSNQKIPSYVK